MNNFVITVISLSILLLVIVFFSLYYVMHIESGKEFISDEKNSSGLLNNLFNTLKVLLLGLLIFFIDFESMFQKNKFLRNAVLLIIAILLFIFLILN